MEDAVFDGPGGRQPRTSPTTTHHWGNFPIGGGWVGMRRRLAVACALAGKWRWRWRSTSPSSKPDHRTGGLRISAPEKAISDTEQGGR